jgi:hypothetical protein
MSRDYDDGDWIEAEERYLTRIKELEAEVLRVKEQAKHDDEADTLCRNLLCEERDIAEKRANDFKAYIDSLREEAGIGDKDLVEWIRRIRGRCDTLDWERQTLDRDLKRALEDAWLRVSTGNFDATVDTKVFPSNMMMFDHPRYTWEELNDLIKGIKR